MWVMWWDDVWLMGWFTEWLPLLLRKCIFLPLTLSMMVVIAILKQHIFAVHCDV